VQKVHLTPFKLSGRTIGSIGDTGLHALDVTDVFDMVRGPVAGIASNGAAQEAGRGHQAGDGSSADALHGLARRDDGCI
jgi:hypothetical protein